MPIKLIITVIPILFFIENLEYYRLANKICLYGLIQILN
jgi:hypothetical protein